MGQKWVKNGSKMDKKWIQNWPEIGQKLILKKLVKRMGQK